MWALHDSFFELEQVETQWFNFLGYTKIISSRSPSLKNLSSGPSSLTRELLSRCFVIPSSIESRERIRRLSAQPFGRIQSSLQLFYAFSSVQRAIWTRVSYQVYWRCFAFRRELIPGALTFGRRQASELVHLLLKRLCSRRPGTEFPSFFIQKG